MKKYIFILLLINYTIFAQFVKNDFKINTDNNPSTFLQTAPVIFTDGSGQILTFWNDYRKGDLRFYSQKLNSSGEKINVNFEAYAKGFCSFFGDTFFTANLNVFPYFEGGVLKLTGRFAKMGTYLSPILTLGGCTYGTCGTGVHTLTYDVKKVNNKIYSMFSDYDGYIQRSAYDRLGNQLIMDTISKKNIELLKLNSVRDGYAIFWVSSSRWEPDLQKYYLYGTFFNNNDELIADSVAIYELSINVMFTQQFMEVRTINDTLHQIIYLNYDQKKIQSFIVNNHGTLYNIASIDVSDYLYKLMFVYNFYLTNSFNNIADLFFSVKDIDENFKTVVYGFDSYGSFIGVRDTSTSFTEKIINRIVKVGNKEYLFVFSDLNDVFISHFENFLISNIKKLNDDVVGSNEENVTIINRDTSSVLMVWKDEQKYRGRIVSRWGDFLSDIKILSNYNIHFLSDNSAIQFFVTSDNNSNILTVTKLSQDLVIEKTDTLKKSDYSPLRFKNVNTLVFNDNIYLIYYTGTEVRLSKYDRYLNFLKDTLFSAKDIAYQIIKLMKVPDENTIIAQADSLNQKFDLNLNPLDAGFRNDLFLIYLGKDRYLKVLGTYGYYNSSRGVIFTSKKDTLAKDILFCDGCENFNVVNVNNDNFLVTFQTMIPEEYRFSVYTSSGVKTTNPIKLVNTKRQEFGTPKNFSAITNGKHLITSWSDPRDTNYNIYSNIYNIKNYLVNVKESNNTSFDFRLEQNYPNPFNPVTTINYSIDNNFKSGNVTLKIYDILGRNIETLVDEPQRPGNYSVQWNATKYSSGIYYYELKAGDFYSVRKMILLK